MRGMVSGVAVVVAVLLGGGVTTHGEMYLWTDEQGVVHMSNQWANVPESARARVSIRDSAPSPPEGMPAAGPAARPDDAVTVRHPPLQMSPDLAQAPRVMPPPPPDELYPSGSSVLIPYSRPFVHHPKKVSPPFPYNVRLDPVDPNFVWVGPSRVPKETFTYPRVSLDAQAQFRNRIRSLEQRRPAPPPAVVPAKPGRP